MKRAMKKAVDLTASASMVLGSVMPGRAIRYARKNPAKAYLGAFATTTAAAALAGFIGTGPCQQAVDTIHGKTHFLNESEVKSKIVGGFLPSRANIPA